MMNKEDILKILEGAKDKNGDVPMRLVRLAFKKLLEPCTDTISRQAAIEIIQSMYPEMPRVPWMRKDWQKRYEPYIRTENAIRKLPSVQQELEHTMEEFMYGQDLGSPEDGSL